MTAWRRAADGTLAIPSGRVARGRIRPPSSKSLTQRALNLALLSDRPTSIRRPLRAEDTNLFLAALHRLGWRSDDRHDRLELYPGPLPESATLWCGNNGTMLRFLTATLATLPGVWTLDGTDRLRRRTVAPLVAALRSLGGHVRWLGEPGFAPLVVEGRVLEAGVAELDAGSSSQFVSALMMAAARARGAVTLRIRAAVSGPYVDLTQRALQAFGGRASGSVDEGWIQVEPAALGVEAYSVEADFSAAAYGAAAAVLTGGEVILQGLDPDSAQGDRRFLEVLERMGARVTWCDSELIVAGGRSLEALSVDLSRMPDQVPTLAALAPFAHGQTILANVAHVRIKESDRLHAMAESLGRLGATVVERPDGLEIGGVWFDRLPPGCRTTVDTHGDHRIAMSLAICGLRRPGVVIDRPEVVEKSYPEFWEHLESLLDE